MKRLMGMLVSFGLLVALTAIPAAGTPDHDSPFAEHGHVLVLGVVLDETGQVPISVRKCVDLANNQALPIHAHHVHMHFGQAGNALSQNNSFVVPVAPFPAPFDEPVSWTDCESLLAAFGL